MTKKKLREQIESLKRTVEQTRTWAELSIEHAKKNAEWEIQTAKYHADNRVQQAEFRASMAELGPCSQCLSLR